MKKVPKNLTSVISEERSTAGSWDQGEVSKKDIWFVINTRGFFKSISPSLLEYLEEMEPQFFEAVLFEKNNKNGLPSPVEYLTEMIQLERESLFVKDVIKTSDQEISRAQWNIIADGPLLKFILSEASSTTEPGERRAS